MRHWALPAAPSVEKTNAESPFRDWIIELPDFLAERLAGATPREGHVFQMPDEDADPTQLASWPVYTGDFLLWPENEFIFKFFSALDTQWQCAGMDGMKTGIPFAAIDSLESRKRICLSEEGFEELRLCESAALAAWEQQRKADADKK